MNEKRFHRNPFMGFECYFKWHDFTFFGLPHEMKRNEIDVSLEFRNLKSSQFI